MLFRKKKQPKSQKFIGDAFLASLLEIIASRTDTSVEWRSAFSSWIAAGVTVANLSLQEIPELRALWSGAAGQTMGITKVFSLAMLSRWSAFVWAPKFAPHELELSVENAAKDILRFFGVTAADAHDEFVAVNAQFNAELDFAKNPPREGMMLVEAELVLSLAARELGRPLSIPITTLSLPVDSTIELMAAGWAPFLETAGTLMCAHSLLADGALAMYSWHEYFLTNGANSLLGPGSTRA